MTEEDSFARRGEGSRLRNVPRRDYNEDHFYTNMDTEDEIVMRVVGTRKRRSRVGSPPVILSRLTIPNESLPIAPWPIESLEDLLRLGEHMQVEKQAYRGVQLLPQIVEPLKELQALVGVKHLKETIYRMVLKEMYVSENPQKFPPDKKRHYRNVVLTGSPGRGKTTVARILAKLFHRLGLSASEDIVYGSPLNMIARYEGQTFGNVNSVVQEAVNGSGILLIDEAHSLNESTDRDGFGKQCLNELVNSINNYPQLIVIFAGYKQEMERCIIRPNPGFRRRIGYFIDIDGYAPEELYQMFLQQLQEEGFRLTEDTHFDEAWFRQHERYFPYDGGSINSLVDKIEMAHIQYLVGRPGDRVITDEMVEKGWQWYLKYALSDEIKQQIDAGTFSVEAPVAAPMTPLVFPFSGTLIRPPGC